MIADEPILTRPLTARQLLALDIVAAAAYTLVLLALALGQGRSQPSVSTSLGAGIVLAMGAPLAVRRLWPVPVSVVAFVASATAFALGVVRDDFLGAGFALYVVALSERAIPRGPTLGIAAVAVLGLLLLLVAGGPVPIASDVGPLLVGAVVLAGSWTIGRAVRERRRFAGRAAAQLAERAVTEERLRIARDLHDVVAHGLSVIVIKAATANHVIDTRPHEARDALAVIESTGRNALAEMRRMLGILRDAEGSDDAASLAPAPGLGDLPALAERVASAGVSVDLSLSGTGALPDGVALSIYRIVQEALTNVVKHAAPAHCRVAIAAGDGSILVEVEDDGARAGLSDGSDTPGHGLAGMRERARLLGGELRAGPTSPRGFRVVARIPYVATPGHDRDPGP